MDDDQRAVLRARGAQFISTFIGIAEGSRDLVEAMNRVLDPAAPVHLQNGEIVTPVVSREHSGAASHMFPDLEVEIEESLFPDDRIVVRVRMTGTAQQRAPFAPRGGPLDVTGAFIARVTPQLTISELWSYLNPGFPFAFPPRGIQLKPPPRDGAGEASARALYESWVQSAEAGEDFVRSVSTSLADDGVVHLGNGDTTDGAGLLELFTRIAQGIHDLTVEIEDVIFDGAVVIAPFRMSGVHGGRLGMFPPTGRILPSTGALLARADLDGRAAEVWICLAPGYALTFPPGRRGSTNIG